MSLWMVNSSPTPSANTSALSTLEYTVLLPIVKRWQILFSPFSLLPTFQMRHGRLPQTQDKSQRYPTDWSLGPKVAGHNRTGPDIFVSWSCLRSLTSAVEFALKPDSFWRKLIYGYSPKPHMYVCAWHIRLVPADEWLEIPSSSQLLAPAGSMLVAGLVSIRTEASLARTEDQKVLQPQQQMGLKWGGTS